MLAGVKSGASHAYLDGTVLFTFGSAREETISLITSRSRSVNTDDRVQIKAVIRAVAEVVGILIMVDGLLENSVIRELY